MIKIYKDPDGDYWVENMCQSIKDMCGECCREGCSVFEKMQEIGAEMEAKSERG